MQHPNDPEAKPNVGHRQVGIGMISIEEKNMGKNAKPEIHCNSQPEAQNNSN